MLVGWLHDCFNLNFYILYFVHNFIMIFTLSTRTVHSSFVQKYSFQESF